MYQPYPRQKRAPTPILESIIKEDTEGVILPVPPVPEEPQANDDDPIHTEKDDDLTNSLEGPTSHKIATTPGIDETPQQLVAPAVAVEVVGGCGMRQLRGR